MLLKKYKISWVDKFIRTNKYDSNARCLYCDYYRKYYQCKGALTRVTCSKNNRQLGFFPKHVYVIKKID